MFDQHIREPPKGKETHAFSVAHQDREDDTRLPWQVRIALLLVHVRGLFIPTLMTHSGRRIGTLKRKYSISSHGGIH
jgi:hypothetical protein